MITYRIGAGKFCWDTDSCCIDVEPVDDIRPACGSNTYMSAETPSYPGMGNPCNGCGLCCLAEKCAIGVGLFGAEGICAALKQGDRGYFCDLLVKPDLYVGGTERIRNELVGYFSEMLGAGKGCDSEGLE